LLSLLLLLVVLLLLSFSDFLELLQLHSFLAVGFLRLLLSARLNRYQPFSSDTVLFIVVVIVVPKIVSAFLALAIHTLLHDELKLLADGGLVLSPNFLGQRVLLISVPRNGFLNCLFQFSFVAQNALVFSLALRKQVA
jgi:hypothetical protein